MFDLGLSDDHLKLVVEWFELKDAEVDAKRDCDLLEDADIPEADDCKPWNVHATAFAKAQRATTDKETKITELLSDVVIKIVAAKLERPLQTKFQQRHAEVVKDLEFWHKDGVIRLCLEQALTERSTDVTDRPTDHLELVVEWLELEDRSAKRQGPRFGWCPPEHSAWFCEFERQYAIALKMAHGIEPEFHRVADYPDAQELIIRFRAWHNEPVTRMLIEKELARRQQPPQNDSTFASVTI